MTKVTFNANNKNQIQSFCFEERFAAKFARDYVRSATSDGQDLRDFKNNSTFLI